MPFILTLLKPIGDVLLSMLMAALTGPVVKRMIARYLEAEAKRYAERAKATADKQDDARAAMFTGMVEDLKKAWGL